MSFKHSLRSSMGFRDGSVLKNPLANAEDLGSIPGSRRSPGDGNGNPLQYSCLGNPMDRGAWQDTVHGIAKSQTQLSTDALIVATLRNPKEDFMLALRTRG